MATTMTIHAPATALSPSPAHLEAVLSTLPTRPRSHLPPVELPPIRQAVPEIDLAPAREAAPPASRYQTTDSSSSAATLDARGSSPYAQKRRLLTPELQDRNTSTQGSPYHSSPRIALPPTSAPQQPSMSMSAYATAPEHPSYSSRGYPENPQPARHLFDPRADYPPFAAPMYARERYDYETAQQQYPAPQYAVYDGGGGAGKRGREFVVAGGVGYHHQAAGYVGDVNGHGHIAGDMGQDGKGGHGGGGRKRRGNLPKETTDKLRAWFVGHLNHPYPTEDEKQELMARTGLQMNQISNWFINARRRQLPNMISNARAETAAAASNGTGSGSGSGVASRDESDGSSYGGGSPGRLR